MKNGIPKLIMQTWKNETVPDNWIVGQESLLNFMPSDYTYAFITDDAMYKFVDFAFPEFKDLFADLPHPIQRADILRYLWLYAYGGIYLDFDYLILKPWLHFIEALNGPLIVLHSSNIKSVLTNSLIIAKPGVPMFLDLAREALSAKTSILSMSKHLEVMMTTGPLAFDRHVRQSKLPYIVLPQNQFLPDSPMLRDEDIEFGGYMKALDGGSWNSGDTVILNFMNKYKTYIVLFIILFITLKLIEGYLARASVKTLLRRIKRSKYKSDLLKEIMLLS